MTGPSSLSTSLNIRSRSKRIPKLPTNLFRDYYDCSKSSSSQSIERPRVRSALQPVDEQLQSCDWSYTRSDIKNQTAESEDRGQTINMQEREQKSSVMDRESSAAGEMTADSYKQPGVKYVNAKVQTVKIHSQQSMQSSLEVPYSDFELKKTIGKGGFGEVVQGTWKKTNVAIKVVYLDPEARHRLDPE